MIPNATTMHIISRWLRDLALVSNLPGDLTKDALKAKLETYAGMLAMEFPSGAFTAESLQAVAIGNPWFPAYDTIRTRVLGWWNENKPRCAPAIGRQRPEGWTEMDEGWLRYWHTRNREIALLDDRRRADFERGRVASLIRTHSPRAWERISGERQSVGKAPSQAEVDAVARHVATARMPVQPSAAPHQRFAQPAVADVSLKGDALVAARAAAKRDVHA